MRYYLLVNGFSFECDEAQIKEYLETFNAACRIAICHGLNGKEMLFDTVEECRDYFYLSLEERKDTHAYQYS